MMFLQAIFYDSRIGGCRHMKIDPLRAHFGGLLIAKEWQPSPQINFQESFRIFVKTKN